MNAKTKTATVVKSIHELNVDDVVTAHVCNHTTDGTEVEVMHIQKTQSGWSFLGKWKDPINGDTMFGQFVRTSVYVCVAARRMGNPGGDTVKAAVDSLGFNASEYINVNAS